MTNLEPQSLSSNKLSDAYGSLVFTWPPKRAVSDRAYLRKVVPSIFVLKLLAMSGLVCIFGSAVLATHGWLRIFLQVCLGAVLAHATELIHQCLHRTATGRASRDHWFGMIIATPL